MSNIWFSADTHFGHRRIIEYCDRPFDSVEEMNHELIANWNDTVASDDDVYFLGDFSLDFKWVTRIVPILHGNIHLVAGNHDLCHSSNTSSGAYKERYREAGFVDVCERLQLQIAGEDILCCHLPYFDPVDIDPRFPELKPQDEGGWLLHGHVHQRWQKRERQINVGVDVWDYFPVSLEAVAGLIKSY